MLWSKLFIPTLREDPGGAEGVSRRLLVRAGYIRPLSPGIYGHLFLAQRSLSKIASMVREEMHRIGAQEIGLPLFLSAGTMAAVARELRSYRQLPQIWYQIQTKFLDAPDPKSGVLRARQTLAGESCSFDLTAEAFDVSRSRNENAYTRVFQRCGVEVMAAEGRQGSRVFVVASDAGEDSVVVCPKCGYAATFEIAEAHARPPLHPDPEGVLQYEPFHTPGRKTIADVAEFTALPETSQMKSLVMVADGTPVLALVRGDHQLSEAKLAAVLGAREIRAAYPAEMQEWFGASAGSLGPVGVKKLRVLADEALKGRRNMICGANKDDFHLRNVTPGKDFSAQFCDLRTVAAGDACRQCGGAVEVRAALAIGHAGKAIFPEANELHVIDPGGREFAPLIGSYGIGIEAILYAIVEQNHDEDGMILRSAIAPFDVVITPVNFAEPHLREAAESIYRSCMDAGVDALLDDRDLRPGVKFKDADLIGIPWRVVVGKKVPEGIVELVERHARKKTEVRIEEVSALVRAGIN